MKNLRQYIRHMILESLAKDTFDEAWFNTEEERPQQQWDKLRQMTGTFHKDKLKQRKLENNIAHFSDEDIDDLFDAKRDVKRLWNETIDKFNLRDFWENNDDIVYFHSLTYYEGTSKSGLQQDMNDEPMNLSVSNFLEKYKIRGNKDEMSTFGVYKGKSDAGRGDREHGFILKGRVTLATKVDAFTESRSKGAPSDMERHKSSGMPKRMLPKSKNINRLVFDEDDIPSQGLGECVLDNWSIVGYVVGDSIENNYEYDMTLKWCDENGIKVWYTPEIFS